MNSKQLEIFVKVVEMGSLSKAAIALGRAQPILSRQIRELESQLDTTLFRRTGRGLTLTESGEQLYGRAVHVLDEMNAAERDLRNFGRAQIARATIAMPTTMGRLIIRPLVQTIYEHYPDIHLRIREGTSGPILDWITAQRVDLAILYDTMPTPRMSTEAICTETMYLVGRAGDARLPEATNVSDLARFSLILPGPTEGLRILTEMVAAQAGIKLTVKIEADTFTAIRQLIDCGYGYSILPYPAVQREVKQGLYQISRLQNPPVTRQLVVTTCARRLPANGIATLARLIKKVVSDAVEGEAPKQTIVATG